MKQQLILIAGPNGAGKTTYYENHLKQFGLSYVGADRINATTGVGAYEAAQVADDMRREYLKQGISFVAETVFSDPVGDKLNFLHEAIAAGYEVTLIYVGLDSPELARDRVTSRVQDGGHNVPDEKIAARYPRSLANLAKALKFVPVIRVYDNSSFDEPFRFLAEFQQGKLVRCGEGTMPKWAKTVMAGLE
jgi:predicted ABC-type ATPase